MDYNPVGWFEIYVSEMARAREFYEAVFGFKMEDMGMEGMEMLGFPGGMEASGATGALAKMEGIGPGGSGTIVYFICQDCSVEAERATQNGGKMVQEKMSIGEHGFIALVQDTEGNVIGLHSMA